MTHVCIDTQENIKKTEDELLSLWKLFYINIGIPYRIIEVVSTHTHISASYEYRFQLWFPTKNSYETVSSFINSTTYFR